MSNMAIIMFSFLSCISIFELVVFARMMFGVTVGFLLAGAPKIVLETVPAHLLTFGFGSFANIFTFFFVSIVVTIKLVTISDKYAYFALYLCPIPFTIVANIGLYFFYAGMESPTHIIENLVCPMCVTHRC